MPFVRHCPNSSTAFVEYSNQQIIGMRALVSTDLGLKIPLAEGLLIETAVRHSRDPQFVLAGTITKCRPESGLR
jgi:hypothetical protein